jgi:outer membrane protein OmpA-like peptidoglycan-associated protein
VRCAEIGIHHNSGLSDIIQEIAIVGAPLGKVNGDCKTGCTGGSMGSLAASLGYVDYGSFIGRDVNGDPTPNYHSRDYSGSLGWGIELLPGFSGGIALKANQSDLHLTSYRAYGTDLGLLWKMSSSIELGAAYSNIKLGGNIGQLVSGLRLGAAWTASDRLLLALSSELQYSAVNRIQLGAEYWIGEDRDDAHALALRAGYAVNYPDPQLTGLTGLTIGLGYNLSKTTVLDYAMVPMGELGASHKLSLTIKFDCPHRSEPQPRIFAEEAAPVPVPVEPRPVFVPVEAKPVVLKSFTLEDSHFDFDKSTLKPEGMAALRENIQLLKDNPNAKVRIAGYTSLRGTEAYNQLLSERRAEAVEAFLIEEGGIDPARLTAIGYGETHPLAEEVSPKKRDSGSPAAKANMRVLFTVYVK